MSSQTSKPASTPSKKSKSSNTESSKKRKHHATSQAENQENVQSPAPKKAKKSNVLDIRDENGEYIKVDGPVPSQSLGRSSPSTESPKKLKKKSKKNKDADVDASQESQEAGANGVSEDAVMQDVTNIAKENPDSTTGPTFEEPTIEMKPPQKPKIIEFDSTLLDSDDPSCFFSTRISLYVPGAPIGLSSAISSLISLHLSPLLLTYFPPAKGIVLAFSDPVISAKPSTSVNRAPVQPKTGNPLQQPDGDTPAFVGDEYTATWVWLTATFLVFRPEKGDRLKGWKNVASEGHVGVLSYNYFQTAVDRARIPEKYTWSASSTTANQKRKRTRIGKLRDDSGDTQPVTNGDVDHDEPKPQESENTENEEDEDGYFIDTDGNALSHTQAVRVVDTDVIPGHERDRWTIEIKGSLLDDEAEETLLQEEKAKFDQLQSRFRHISVVPDVVMSGGVGAGREGSVGTIRSAQTPTQRHRVAY